MPVWYYGIQIFKVGNIDSRLAQLRPLWISYSCPELAGMDSSWPSTFSSLFCIPWLRQKKHWLQDEVSDHLHLVLMVDLSADILDVIS